MIQQLKTIMMIMTLPLALMACGGSSGGGGGGAAVDNSKASGTYSFVVIEGSNAEVGSITFDGAGGGTVTDISPTPDGPNPITYTSYSDNSISLDTMVGTIREGGNFIVLSNTNNGSEALILAVKNSALSDTANTYRFGQFGYDSTLTSEVVIVDVDTATPSAGFLSWSTVAPSVTGGTDIYAFDNSSGTYLVTANGGLDEAFGAISPDGQINIYGDGTETTDTFVYGGLGLEFPSSGMTVADLSGTYIMHQFMDEDVTVTGPSFITSRIRVVANGDGTGTYASIASSTGGSSSGPLTYTVSGDGSMTVFGDEGFLLADGSVFVFVDHDTSGDDLDIKVAVRQ